MKNGVILHLIKVFKNVVWWILRRSGSYSFVCILLHVTWILKINKLEALRIIWIIFCKCDFNFHRLTLKRVEEIKIINCISLWIKLNSNVYKHVWVLVRYVFINYDEFIYVTIFSIKVSIFTSRICLTLVYGKKSTLLQYIMLSTMF